MEYISKLVDVANNECDFQKVLTEISDKIVSSSSPMKEIRLLSS